MTESGENVSIVPSDERSRSQAAAIMFQHLTEAERAELFQTLLSFAAREANPFAGLFEARRGETLVGAVWAQIQPGNVAVLWPPGTLPQEPRKTIALLMDRAVEFLQVSGVTMAQTLLNSGEEEAVSELTQAGFRHFADLHYMACTSVSFPSQLPDSQFTYLAWSPEHEDRFQRVIEATYDQTLDCPALNGVRPTSEVLAGYRATGVFRPENWRLITGGQGDLGCLLLADHPAADQIELVYMGIVPGARGRRLGFELTRHAQWLTRCAGRSRLVLAVDAANRPAIDVYLAAGFFAWDRRSVFLRTFAA